MKMIALGAIAACAFAVPASAIVNFTTAGQSATINFNGIASGFGVTPGLSAALALTFTGFTGSTANFSYVLHNTSSAPYTNSRISVFGFDSAGANFVLGGSSGSAPFDGVASSNIGGYGTPEICFTAGPNCAGGSGGGLIWSGGASTSLNGSFTLAFGGPQTQVSLERFVVRYQSLDASNPSMRGNSGYGIGSLAPDPFAVPEPATWAMLIAGFGLVGASLRRRRGISFATA